MFYMVFTYSPDPIDDFDSPCLAITLDNISSSSRQLDVYLSALWNDITEPRHHEYIWTLFREWYHRKELTDVTGTLEALEDLSVGPLRIRASGICMKAELPHLLESIFGQPGYFLVGPDHPLTIGRSVAASTNILNCNLPVSRFGKDS
jgi:hypothetical protein